MLFHELYYRALQMHPEGISVVLGDAQLTYTKLHEQVEAVAAGMMARGLECGDRVAIYAAQGIEMVVAMLATSRAGGVFVPINPGLKSAQVGHILDDCSPHMLIVDKGRYAALAGVAMPGHVVVLSDDAPEASIAWLALVSSDIALADTRSEEELAALFYTSGSTGRPKGVMLSHANLVEGARSVSSYLANSRHDRLLCALPLSFDYGFSQLSTALSVGARVVLINYLFPKDVLNAVDRHGITGLACVPPLWQQLVALGWPEDDMNSLRYITNSGGQLPASTVQELRQRLPQAQLFLMYGLTEAFRSTYVDPDRQDLAVNAIGLPIPGATIDVVNPEGEICAVGEQGELVHSGPLVAQGYWQDPARSAIRFRPAPEGSEQAGKPAVWSGDIVYRDEEGILYFVGREDGQIKTSGYRVSPTEIEEAILALDGVAECVVVGAPHEQLGQAIIVFVTFEENTSLDEPTILRHGKQLLPAFMVPRDVMIREVLPRNANGKHDRVALQAEVSSRYADPADVQKDS